MGLSGVGPHVAAGLLAAAGDSPERMRSETTFTKLCGACPIPASSGKTNRHRLNRGGDRRADNLMSCRSAAQLRRDGPGQARRSERRARGADLLARAVAGTEGTSKQAVIRRAVLERYERSRHSSRVGSTAKRTTECGGDLLERLGTE